MKKGLFGLTLFTLIFFSINSSANDSTQSAPNNMGEVVLANINLSHGRRLNTVIVNSCEQGIMVDSVKFKVTQNTADIDYLELLLTDGQALKLEVNGRLKKGYESPWLYLGSLRCVLSLNIFGETRTFPLFSKSKVTLLGDSL